MKMLTRYISALALISLLTGCAASAPAAEGPAVVTTIFPLYDLVSETAGDADAEISCLIDNAVDMHSYTPTSQDILAIAECDLIVYVGGESDEWIEEVLEQHPDDERIALRCFDVLEGSLIAEDEPGENGYDEHVWLSLRNAELILDAIADALQEADPDRAETYRANAEAMGERIAELEGRYARALSGTDATLVIADRFPFAYLARDYGLNCHSAFSGCSAETEASFQVVADLADVVAEHGLKQVFVIDGGDEAIARAVIAQAGADDAEVLSLNSMQALGRDDIYGDADYLSLMEENLALLEEAVWT